jgi:hypothetical protein
MIGALLPSSNIDIFLTKEEIEDLSQHALSGKLVKYEKPTIQLPLKLNLFNEGFTSVNGTKRYIVCLPREKYKELKESRHLGTRYNNHLKLEIAEEDYANKDYHLSSFFRGLKERLEDPIKFI